MTSIEDPLKRAFYEQETIRGCWTVRELDRQVSSQYYERMGLSKDKKALQKLAVSKYRLQLPSEDDIKQYLLENISEEKFKELKEEEENAE